MATQYVTRESMNTKSRHVTLTYMDKDDGQRVIGSSDPLPTIDINHLRLHEGRAYYVYHTHKDAGRLAVGSSINIAIAFPAGVYAHSVLDYQCGGEAEIYVYESPTTSGGTAMTIHRRNRALATTSVGAAVLNPTVTSVGTEFYSELITSAEGQGNRSGAGGKGFSFEFVFNPLTTYLFRLTNVNSSSQMAEMRIDWYE
jgi:hypothetical protein